MSIDTQLLIGQKPKIQLLNRRQSLQRNEIHRFFQSIHNLPSVHSCISLQDIDKRVIYQGTNLYSLFQLLVILKSQQKFADRPIALFRRIMSLIYCILSHYQVYFSKIKTLTCFWWESCLKINKDVTQINIANKKQSQINQFCGQIFTKQLTQKLNKFRQKIFKFQYIFHVVRTFNLLIKGHHNSKCDKKSILFLVFQRNPLIYQNIQTIIKRVEKILRDTAQQSKYKALLAIQFSHFLISNFQLRKTKRTIQYLFCQFWRSVKIIIRIFKKFYHKPNLQYRAMFANVIFKAFKVFQNELPNHKRQNFYQILKYLNRKRDYSEEVNRQRKPKQESQLNAQKIVTLKLTSKAIHCWKIKLAKKMESIQAKEKQQLIHNHNTSKNQQQISLSTKNTIKKDKQQQSVSQRLRILKKRSQSFKQSSGAKPMYDIFQNDQKCKLQVEKQFERLKICRKRFKSASNKAQNNNEERCKKIPVQRQVQLKIQQYKRTEITKINRYKETKATKLCLNKIS